MLIDQGLNPSPLLDIKTLDKKVEAIVSSITQSNNPSGDAQFALFLLESFTYQKVKLDRLSYCDYSLAYVCYKACKNIIAKCSVTSPRLVRSFLHRLLATLDASQNAFMAIAKVLQRSGEEDNLNQRLNNLIASESHSKNEIIPEFQNYKYCDFVTASQLNYILRKSPDSILLLDFRTEKEYSYSHINFLNVVNIQPALVADLLRKAPNATDADLEEELGRRLPPGMLQLFKERRKFDIVVMYNLRYGQPGSDKFKSLVYLADQSYLLKNSPFHNLVELLAWKNKYLSSKLKQFPLVLDGGMKFWHQKYGQEALISSSSEIKESVKSEHIRELTPLIRDTRYLRRFNDYLAKGSSVIARNDIQLSRPPPSLDRKSMERSYEESQDLQEEMKCDDKNSPTELSPKKALANIPSQVSTSGLELKQSPDTFENLTTGLTNLGNSCYMNCVLQCLVATPPLTKFFFEALPDGKIMELSYKEHINRNNRLGTKGAVTVTLVKLILDMLTNRDKYFTPTDFKKIIGQYSPGRQFATTQQQDCIEFLNFILDSLHEDLNKVKFEKLEDRARLLELSPQEEKNREELPVQLASTIEWERYLALNLSVIVDYFQGQYLSRLRCLVCNLTSTTYNSFSILSLPIPERIGRQPKKISFFDCLDFFTETELLEDDNKWHCPACKRFTRLTKKITISRLPSILIIHFKRFSQTKGSFKKLDTFIEYPVEKPLDVTSYWPPVGTYLDSDNAHRMDIATEKAYLSELPERNQVAPFKYKLYGVVNHYGNLTTGHYTSYVRKKSNSESWYYFDDSKYTPNCKPEKVLNPNAYCLFFRRI